MPRLRPAPEEKEPKVEAAAAEAEKAQVIEQENGEIEVILADEPEAPESPPENDATAALKKQIEDLKKSEQIHKERAEQFAREREEALTRAREREARIVQVQKEAYDSQADAISSALAAAQAEADKAQLDIENAISLGDAKGQAEAQKRLAIAAANLTRLEEGKEAAEARAKEAPKPQDVDPIDTWGLPDITTKWLKNHRHWLTDPVKLNKLRYFQDQAAEAGITPHTPQFLEWIEVKIGERQPPEDEPVVETKPEPKPKSPPVSAPVSRETVGSNGKRQTGGKVTLTPKEVEAAQISGISVEEYAKQKQRKEQMVESGEYGEQPRG